MEITSFIVTNREQTLLYGDYSIYHGRLTKRLLNCRKKLGIATKNRGKFHPKTEVTPEEIAQNHGYVHLLLLTSERAWAQALNEKSLHSSSKKGIAGKARNHIISRLTKATRAADNLVEALSQSDLSGASSVDILEANAYASLIRGALLFEKQNWKQCLPCYATARVIYTALASVITSKDDLFKDLLKETIDPSIRIAAYQLESTRSVPIPVIAQKAFPKSNAGLVDEINRIDPSILQEGEEAKEGVSGAKASAPKTLTWRSREVALEDVDIAVAWGEVLDAKERLLVDLSDAKDRQPHELASAYDEILLAAQEAVDATKKAVDELRAEGVDQADPRMQKLQIIRTAVNFEMISWRIGRNRVLTGRQDGATEEYGPLRRRKLKAGQEPAKQDKDLPTGKKLIKLKEKVALHSGILQSIDSIKELPGVANDQELATQIESFAKYFQALRALSIARSHAITGNPNNTLAIIHHAFELSRDSLSIIPKSSDAVTQGALSLTVSPEAVESLGKLLEGELQRYRAIVYINDLREDKKEEADDGVGRPLIESLNEYPVNGADLTNIVEYPPKMALVPVKPIFLDVAWNYIDYPSKAAKVPEKEEEKSEQPAPQQPAKRGWFGFGRS